MPYATNLPRRDRPRGLGDVPAKASGLGTWIVDDFWGLSPSVITGQPRPYGQTVVQTMLPRSLQPRLQNLHMGPVIPGGTWPQLRRMNNQPVFRTPVERPGAIQMSLPPGAGGVERSGVVDHAVAGYGDIPMGIAHRPAYLLEPPGMQGYGGFGQGDGSGMTVTAMGQSVHLSDLDVEWMNANSGVMKKIFVNTAKLYINLAEQQSLFDEQLLNLSVMIPNMADRRRAAELAVYGDPLYPGDVARAAANHAQALSELQQLNRLRVELATDTPVSDTASWPADVRAAYQAFISREAPGVALTSVNFGAVEPISWMALLYTLAKVAIAVGAITAVTMVAYSAYVGTVAAHVEVKRAESEADVRKSVAVINMTHAEAVAKLSHCAETAATEQLRLACMDKLAQIVTEHDKAQGARAAAPSGFKPGGSTSVATIAMVLGLAVIGGRWLFATKSGRRSGKKSKGGGGGGGGGYQGHQQRQGQSAAKQLLG